MVLRFELLVAGLVTLSPSGVAQVCARQQLEVMCTTNETSLVWNFVPPLVNNQGISIRQDWFIASTDVGQQLQELRVNSTTFTFGRSSMQHRSPMVSTMTIANSSGALNMSGIRCTEVVNDQLAAAATSTIQVVGDTDNQTGKIQWYIHCHSLHCFPMEVGIATVNPVILKECVDYMMVQTNHMTSYHFS